MCGRYSITTPVEALARLFRSKGPALNLPPRYNVAPTQQVPIVRVAPNDRCDCDLAMVRWGLVPFWAKDASIVARMINARAEGIAERAAFRAALKLRRCLMPADELTNWGCGNLSMSATGLGCAKTIWEVGQGARLIRKGCRSRTKDSPKPHVLFFYCGLTTASSVFTQPGS